MLFGQIQTQLDNKNRLTLPAKFRDYFQIDSKSNVKAKIIISSGLDGCLVLRNSEEFQKWENKILHHQEGLKETRILIRHIFANSEEITIDSKGRIIIPGRMLEIGKILDKVIFVGVLNKIELWSVASWESFHKETIQLVEQAATTLGEV